MNKTASNPKAIDSNLEGVDKWLIRKRNLTTNLKKTQIAVNIEMDGRASLKIITHMAVKSQTNISVIKRKKNNTLIGKQDLS